ncbi:FG-GAP-like repeat-containing protein [Microbacterium sp. GCS4]|uniref:FG-GAP-like repeat-containing protein n=1 Tax=Microbacterium sp. GCS4 TaxID=1692239 RepID=UPI0006819760|nr:FG-GAP-like repeat-containing protein [Microbacterium sp. GCS4]
MHPDAAALGAANGLVLKDGNGGLRLAASCSTASTANQVRVERVLDGRTNRICFDVVFRPAVLNLEIDSSFGVKAGKQPLEVFFEINGVEDTLDLAPTRSGTVDEDRTGQSTIVTLDVKADAADVPVTDAAFPRTAIGQVRSALGACTGTLVDRSWVLTAASCLAADPATLVAGAPVAPVRVLFGADIANDKTTGGTGAGSKVTQVQPAGSGADAVMLKLETPIDTITPIAPATTAPTVGENLVFTGYGRTASVWVPLAAHTYTYPVTDVASATATASATGAALCLGDGGAPGIRTVNGTQTLAAIASTSSQAGCLGSGIPAGTASVTSTRVDTIAPWIAQTVQRALNTTPVSAADKALAQQITATGRVTEPGGQLQAYAEGFKRGNLVDGTIRDCTIDPMILAALKKVVVDDGFSITISSLNENCTTAAPSTTSYHAKDGGGHAVDISVVNGVASTGDTAEDRALITAMFTALPAPAGLGQVSCRGPLTVPNGWAQTIDDCTHTHFEYHGTPLTPSKPSFDLNSDGKADIVGITSTNALNIYQGNGNGGWAAQSTVSTGWADAKVIIHGDYNGDGKGDMMVVNTDGTLWFHQGDGALKFPTKSLVARGWDTKSLITGGVDFNGDKKADLVARESDGNLYAYPGIGNGTFGPKIQIGNGWGGINRVLAGDWTGDGKGDILATTPAGALILYPGNGSTLTSGPQVGQGWAGITAITGGVDYGLDGKADLFGRTADGGLYVYPGLGASGFGAATRVGNGWDSLRLFS